MRLHVDGDVVEGSAIELPTTITAATLRRAIRADRDDPDEDTLRLDCSRPGPGHAQLWQPATPPPRLSVVGLLAAAARSRGYVASQRDELADVLAALEAIEPRPTDTTAARRAVAESGAAVERLRETVATIRGRLQARRTTGAATDEATVDLADAIGRLSEAETERVAAEQTLEAAERRARANRTRREHRLRLRDRADNLERAARRELAARVHRQFVAALAVVPGDGRAGGDAAGYVGDDVTAALAAVRVASLDAPVVDETGRFASAAAAADCLDVPVLWRSFK